MSSLTAVLITGIAGIFIHPTVLLGFKFPDLGFLGWFFLIPLFFDFISTQKRIFVKGFAAAFIFYLGSFYWLVNAMKNFGGLNLYESVGVLLLIVLIFSFYWGLFASAAMWVTRTTKIPAFLTLTLFLTAMDLLRTYFPVGGFTWSMPGYSQGSYMRYFEWVDTLGVLGLSFFIYLINGLLTEIIYHFYHHRMREHGITRAAILLVFISLSVFGSLARKSAINEESAKNADGVTVGLVQANIPQDMKWNLRVAKENLGTHLDLTDQAYHEGAELVVWPETSYPFTINLATDRDMPYLFWRGRTVLPTPLLLGAVSMENESDEAHVYNSAYSVNTQAQIESYYHKRHLVPFGEYIPLKKWLTFAKRLTVAVGDFSPGTLLEPLQHESLKMGVLICYEDIFSDLSRTAVKAGANILVNLTNDAWYGNTSAPYQHLVFSQFRALETRRYLLRATNTGVTAIIDPRGAVVSTLPPFAKGVLTGTVYGLEGLSPYVRMGDAIGYGATLLVMCGMLAALILKFIRRKDRT